MIDVDAREGEPSVLEFRCRVVAIDVFAQQREKGSVLKHGLREHDALRVPRGHKPDRNHSSQ